MWWDHTNSWGPKCARHAPSLTSVPLLCVSTSRNGAGTGVAYRKISLLCIIPAKNKTHSFNTNTHGIQVWWTKEPCHFWSILQCTIKMKGRVFRGGGTSWHCRWSVEEGKLWHNNMATLAIYAIMHWLILASACCICHLLNFYWTRKPFKGVSTIDTWLKIWWDGQ